MSKKIDLTGQIFGHWTILEPAPNRNNYWTCQCSCGKIKQVAIGSLKSGRSTSCHRADHRMDLTGQTFGQLTVIGPAPSRKSSTGNITRYWKCRCSCGAEKEILAGSLRSGNTTSCGCQQLRINLTGQVFGELTIIKPAPDRISSHGTINTQWICHCSCRNIKSISTGHLQSGHTTSCGCRQGRSADLTGQVFGRLTAIKRAPGRTKCGSAYWTCRCLCGNTVAKVRTRNLLADTSTSCGCKVQELKTRTGPEHPNWNPQLTDEHREQRRLRKTDQYMVGMRTVIFERDNYTCQHCGHHGKTLAAHHIMPWATYPTLRYALENCITLCKDCHTEFHAMYGTEDFDNEDLKEYLT